MPCLPILNSERRPWWSISTLSNTSSRSSVSPGTNWKYHASSPVSPSRASTLFVYSASPSVLRDTRAHGLACEVDQ